MIQCLDIHTHHSAPQPITVVSAASLEFTPLENQLYSIGIHPWESDKLPSAEEWEAFEKMASQPFIAAIGECGVDKLKGGPLYKQLIIFKKQVDISEKLKKPIIIHDVKAHDVITGLKRDYKPTQKWLVHGLRAKPTVAKMLTDAGIYVSFGEKFNIESPAVIPAHMLLAETDESSLSIEEIIANLAQALNISSHQLTGQIAENTAKFLFGDA